MDVDRKGSGRLSLVAVQRSPAEGRVKMRVRKRNEGRYEHLIGIVSLSAIAAPFCFACTSGNDCEKVKSYNGTTSQTQGTLTYGQPPVTKPFSGQANPTPDACMQTPDTCGSLSFGCGGYGPLHMTVTANPFKNGQVITLPSPWVSISAYFDDGFVGLPYDGGAELETLTLVSGSITITISLNNFQAQFDMTFTKPNGDPVVIQNGQVALLNATLETNTVCQ